MKKVVTTVLAYGLFLGLTASVLATDTKAPKPIVVKDKVTMKATVEAIDKAHRSLTIKGSKGDVLTLPVDESVDRFDQIKVGDQITAEYYESVAYEIRKPGTPAAPDTFSGAAASMSGEKPGGAVMKTTVTTVTIEAIDPATPAVTVRTSDGNSLSFRVRNKKNLKGVEVGDTVVVTQTAALMIAVQGAN